MTRVQFTVVEHPLIQHKLSLMRRKETPIAEFRQLARELGALLAYEATRDLPLVLRRLETPLGAMDAPMIDGKKLCFVAILRAGMGLLEGMLDLVPSARVGHIGLYRDPKTLRPVEYFCKVPNLTGRLAILLDPMLATGRSAAAAMARLKREGAREIKMVCLVAAPGGIAECAKDHPDVPIFAAARDSHLDEHGYIVPGLGDAGDRLFGTR